MEGWKKLKTKDNLYIRYRVATTYKANLNLYVAYVLVFCFVWGFLTSIISKRLIFFLKFKKNKKKQTVYHIANKPYLRRFNSTF